MSAAALHVTGAGLASPLGFTAIMGAAAMRAGLDRRSVLPYVDDDGTPIVGSAMFGQENEFRAGKRWTLLAARAIEDALAGRPLDIVRTRLFFALPEGRYDTSELAEAISAELGFNLDAQHIDIGTGGSAAGVEALVRAQTHLRDTIDGEVLVCAADSLIAARPLHALFSRHRLLTRSNSDGVVPGEAAACIVASLRPEGSLARIRGIGIAREPATLFNDVPLRGDGLTTAVRSALAEARCPLHAIDFRLSDAAGESFFFKEHALAMNRVLEQNVDGFPLWQSAATLGDVGTASGLANAVWAVAAMQSGYAPGPNAIVLASSAEGHGRAALVLQSADTAVKGPE